MSDYPGEFGVVQGLQDRIAELEAEVARLTHELVDAKRSRDDAIGRCVEAQAEVERRKALAEATQLECNRLAAEVAQLRRERDAALVHGPEDMVRALEEVRAEVERLRAKLKDTASAREIMSEHTAMLREFALKAEVERLRTALETAREYVPRQAVVTLELCDVALRGEGEPKHPWFEGRVDQELLKKFNEKFPAPRGEGEKWGYDTTTGEEGKP